MSAPEAPLAAVPAAAVAPGTFADPAREAAVAFRAALDALARPGTAQRLAGAEPPEGLSRAAAVLLLTLADIDTPVWLPRRLSEGPAAEWLAFHANAPLAGAEAEAVFAVGTWAELAPLDRWPAGDAAYPDRSATLVLELPALSGGPRRRLSGPGIPGEAAIDPPLPDGAAEALEANAARFPLGVDLFLAAGDTVLGLPRTIRIGG